MQRLFKHSFIKNPMKAKEKKEKVIIDTKHLLELIHWARRYADMRCTYVPSDFNRIYDSIMKEYPYLKSMEFKDETLIENGRFFPYATDGDYKTFI